jgi:hypothetical protein
MPNTKVNLYTVTPTATAAATFGESTRKTRRRSCRDTSATNSACVGDAVEGHRFRDREEARLSNPALNTP